MVNTFVPAQVASRPEALRPRDTTRNVKRWRDGKMIKRWCAAGMLNTERKFRRLKGHAQMPVLAAALARHVEAVTPACDTAKVA